MQTFAESDVQNRMYTREKVLVIIVTNDHTLSKQGQDGLPYSVALGKGLNSHTDFRPYCDFVYIYLYVAYLFLSSHLLKLKSWLWGSLQIGYNVTLN